MCFLGLVAVVVLGLVSFESLLLGDDLVERLVHRKVVQHRHAQPPPTTIHHRLSITLAPSDQTRLD